MKKFLGICIGLVAASLSVSAWSADPAAAPSASSHPCKTIEAACSAAGFIKGGAKTGKGMMKDCMKPIMSGESVSGVTVTADEVAACKAKMASHGMSMGGGMAAPAAPAAH
jgi:hypothetical protein